MLLIAGGLLEAATLTVGSFISPPGTTVLGASLLVGYTAGVLLTGFGLIATGVSLAGRGRIALRIAGVLALVAVIVSGVQSATGAPLGPGPSQAASVLYVVAIVVAAVRLLSEASLHGAVRWAIAVPATCFILNVVAVFVPLPSPGVIVVPWVGTAVAGALLVGPLGQPSTVEARFIDR